MKRLKRVLGLVDQYCDKTIIPLPTFKDLRLFRDFIKQDAVAYFNHPNKIYKTKIIKKLIVVIASKMDDVPKIFFKHDFCSISLEFLYYNSIARIRFSCVWSYKEIVDSLEMTPVKNLDVKNFVLTILQHTG